MYIDDVNYMHLLFCINKSSMLRLVSPDDGKLHKAINTNDKMHIIEEMILFSEPEPVQHIELDPQRV